VRARQGIGGKKRTSGLRGEFRGKCVGLRVSMSGLAGRGGSGGGT